MEIKKGRPIMGEQKKKLVTIRVEPDLKKAAEEKHGSFQKFIDAMIYKLVPKRNPRGKYGKYSKLPRNRKRIF